MVNLAIPNLVVTVAAMQRIYGPKVNELAAPRFDKLGMKEE